MKLIYIIRLNRLLCLINPVLLRFPMCIFNLVKFNYIKKAFFCFGQEISFAGFMNLMENFVLEQKNIGKSRNWL
jgi:hypothetical protein